MLSPVRVLSIGRNQLADVRQQHVALTVPSGDGYGATSYPLRSSHGGKCARVSLNSKKGVDFKKS